MSKNADFVFTIVVYEKILFKHKRAGPEFPMGAADPTFVHILPHENINF